MPGSCRYLRVFLRKMSHDERVTHPDQHAAADTADPVGSTRLQPSSANQEDQLGQAGNHTRVCRGWREATEALLWYLEP